jgi:ribosomal protein L16 Arg81 hydroxylase
MYERSERRGRVLRRGIDVARSVLVHDVTHRRPLGITSHHIAFLEEGGARGVAHSGRTFLDHLLGTAEILQRWGGGAALVKAGLFHSVYGTEYFRDSLVSFDGRARVRALIGDEAEHLAFLFCACERGSIHRALRHGAPHAVSDRRGGGTLFVTPSQLRDLVWLAWANSLEQVARLTPSAAERGRSQRALAACAAHLSPAALLDLEAAYGPWAGPREEAMPTPGLRSLFNLDDPASFVAHFWPDRLFLARGPVERLAGLVDYDFDALVRMQKHHTTAFFRTLDGESKSLAVQAGQERPLYEAGFTIYFHNLRSPGIDEWVAALDAELGLVRGVTRVAGFASRRGLGLKPHYDQNDNFVCQARGMKRWRIAPNHHVRYPTLGYTMGAKPLPVHEVEAADGFPDELPPDHQTVELRPGAVMFMPRGMWHDTETVEEESLHFNVQSGLPTWRDAIEYVLTQTSALHGEELRGPVQRMFDDRGLRAGFDEELKEKLREVVETVFESDIRIHRDAFHRFIMARRPTK